MSKGAVLRAAFFASPAFFLAAANDTVLAPGLWEVRHTPGQATLDGKLLDDLPLGEPRTQQICLAAHEASDPVAFFARDTQADCRVTSGSAAGGKVDIKGSCPNPEEGNEGTMSLSGRYAGDSYELDFATRSEDFQGVMTFSGKLSGRRIGPCPTN
jgi:hypothetical protein